MAKNDSETKVPTIEVPLARNKSGAVDVKQTVTNAEKVASDFARQDAEASKAVAATTSAILNDAKHEKVTCFTAGTLAKMALGLMGEIPTEKLCDETEERVKSFLSNQPEKYLHIPRGRNSGFHVISRYTKEDLASLQKSAKASEASAK